MQINVDVADVVNYWLESQSKEMQLLLKNKSYEEIEYLVAVVNSFTEAQCKEILTKLSKSQDSHLEFQSLF